MYTRFQTKTAQNPTQWGGTYLYGLYKGVPSPPPRGLEPSPDLSPLGLPSKISEKYPRPCHMPIAPAQPHLSSDERAGHGGRIVGVKEKMILSWRIKSVFIDLNVID